MDVVDPDSGEFTIVNIDRRKYHRDAGINKLAREIMEENGDLTIGDSYSRIKSTVA